MRTSTTATDLRRIMKLKKDGENPKDISLMMGIDVSAIENVIKIRAAQAAAEAKANAKIGKKVDPLT